MGLNIDNTIYVVLQHKHVKPGKGGAFARIKIKNMKTQQVLEKTIKPSDKVEEASLEERKLQLLYTTGDAIHFMDNSSYEEVVLSSEALGDDMKFLQDNLEVVGIFYNNSLLKVNLPIFITAQITHTEPGFKGDTSGGATKPATIDTGATILVPLFVNQDDWIKVDTRTGDYVERVKK